RRGPQKIRVWIFEGEYAPRRRCMDRQMNIRAIRQECPDNLRNQGTKGPEACHFEQEGSGDGNQNEDPLEEVLERNASLFELNGRFGHRCQGERRLLHNGSTGRMEDMCAALHTWSCKVDIASPQNVGRIIPDP